MSAPNTPHNLDSRVEAVEHKLAWLEKTADDLDEVLREMYGRMEQLERTAQGMRRQIEQLVDALGAPHSPGGGAT